MGLTKKSWDYGIASHAGTVKTKNEDTSFLRIGVINHKLNLAIAIIADGMGGYDAGDIASQFVVKRIVDWWDHHLHHLIEKNLSLMEISKQLVTVLRNANDELVRKAKTEGKRMGTTLSLLLLFNGNYRILHAGDSRIYKFSLIKLSFLNQQSISAYEQLTEDQSWVGLQEKQGRLTKEAARLHPKRSVLLQCIGIDPKLDIFVTGGSYSTEDIFFLCSDGYYSLFSDEEILSMVIRLINGGISIQGISERLVELAVHKGAEDNVSVILLKQSLSIPPWKKLLGVFK